MNRIEIINNYADRRDLEEKSKIEMGSMIISDFENKVMALQSRIEEIIAVGSECIKRNVLISTPCQHDGYETQNFMADGVNHQFGFVFSGYINFCPSGISKIGIEYYNDEWIYTDGETVEYGKNTFMYGKHKEMTEKWLEKFEKFETAFYSYIDSLK